MKQVIGNKTIEVSELTVRETAKDYSEVCLDLGTGDGRYVYKKALEKPETLYIGVDPVEKQLQKYSRKAVRKGVSNALFVVGSAENLPLTQPDFLDEMTILLPWGSLLDYVANGDQAFLQSIQTLLKPEGTLEILFGYTSNAEPTETDRLNLERLTSEYIKNKLIPRYLEQGFSIVNLTELTREELREYETTWSKKLSFGKGRPMFQLEFQTTN